MMNMAISFDDLKGKVAVITGGAGVIGSSLAEALSRLGVITVILDINEAEAVKVASAVEAKSGTRSFGVMANVLDKQSLQEAYGLILSRVGDIDILINGAGGNHPDATSRLEFASSGQVEDENDTFYGLDPDAFRKVFDLNFLGTMLPVMVLTAGMKKRGRGVVLNISSMNAFRPLTRIPAYSAAKASINNFTQWLAVHLAKAGIRVNAIAPGFFLTHQNRFLLTEKETGELTERGKKVMASTPMGRFGNPDELAGTVAYLLSDISAFVTGVIIPVDGGFNAYSGV